MRALDAVEAAADSAPPLAATRWREQSWMMRSAGLGWSRWFQCVVLPAMPPSASTPGMSLPALLRLLMRRWAGPWLPRVDGGAALYEPGRESVFVVTEAVLRTWPGTPSLMLAQLDRLVAVESLSTVRLGVIRWSRPVPPTWHGFTLCDRGPLSWRRSGTSGSCSIQRGCLVPRRRSDASRAQRSSAMSVRELLLRVMKEFRDLADTVTP